MLNLMLSACSLISYVHHFHNIVGNRFRLDQSYTMNEWIGLYGLFNISSHICGRNEWNRWNIPLTWVGLEPPTSWSEVQKFLLATLWQHFIKCFQHEVCLHIHPTFLQCCDNINSDWILLQPTSNVVTMSFVSWGILAIVLEISEIEFQYHILSK
jgi:hypothetical protein